MAITPTSTAADLIKELGNITKCTQIIDIVKHANANEEVLNEAIDIADRKYYNTDTNHNTIMYEVIKSNKVTPKLLIKVIEKTGSCEIIVAAINSTVVDEDVLNKAIDIAGQKFFVTDTNYKSVMNKVIKSNKVTPELLVKVIEKTSNVDVIVNAIESPYADDSVYKAALIKAKSLTTNSASVIFDAVTKAQSNPKPKIINIKPPQVSDKSNSEKKSVTSENSNNKDTKEEAKKDFEEEIIIFNVENEDNVTERLRRNVEDGMSTMLWGLSGIGKTARVKEVDPDYTMIKLKNDMLPEEVTGGKEPNGEPGAIYPPFWYVRLCEKCEKEPDKMHILFIDELTNVKNNVKSLVWDIIEDRRVNGNEDWELPENCAVVAAGNRPEESTAVITDYNGGVLPEPLHDRFDFHIEIPLDMAEWQQWALETNPKTGNLNIHPSVLSFCVAHAKDVMFTSINVDDITQPRLSPRRWEKLSKAIYMAEKRGGKACHVSNQRITECIGKDIAPAFIAHYEKQPLSMKKVEAGLYKPDDFKNIDDKLFALSSLIAEYKGSHMAVIDFIETCLGDDYVAVYNVMKNQQNELISSGNTEEALSTDTVKK